METLFVFDKRNYQDCQQAFRGPKNREYYLGDYSIDSGAAVDVRAERKAVGSASIIRLRSRSRQLFRRTWAHIREDGTDVAILCFVKRGWVSVSHADGESVARAGDFIVTKSSAPFSVESHPAGDGMVDLLHLTVPMHLLRRIVCDDVRMGLSMPAKGRRFAIAERILSELFEDNGEIGEDMEQRLVDSALDLLGNVIKGEVARLPRREKLPDLRLNDVLRYIETHLSDSKLSVITVAEGCGISPRYLSLLLKMHGTTFSTLVWDKRLKAAGQWLATTRPSETCISEVAFRSGFKSPAHFSRMFKREFKVSPRQYRTANELPLLPARAARVVVDGGEARH